MIRYTKSFIVAVLICLVSQDAFAQRRYDKDTRIAIIGAGASGLTAAYNLMKKGYDNITVFEKNDRVGGKVYSYKHNDYWLELGAFWTSELSPTALAMIEDYGLEARPENADMIVRQTDGQNYSFQQHLLKNNNVLQIAWAFLNFKWVQAKFKKDLMKAGFDDIDPDLYLPFDEFIKKYRIKPLANAFRPFWIGCGYGYYDKTPAAYVLKLMVTRIDASFSDMINKYLPFGETKEGMGLLRITTGYSSLFEAIASDISDVRLNSEVTKVERFTGADGKTIIRISANGQTDEFDKVIISTDLKAARKFLDVNNEEDELFSMIKSLTYHIYLVEADHIEYPLDSFIFLDENGTSDTIGSLEALVNRSALPNVWITGQLAPDDATSDDVIEWLGEDISYLGGNLSKIIKEQVWDYFPYADTEAFEAGFYDRLNDLQGEKGTYYVGGIMNFETVEHTSLFAKTLVENNF